MNLDKPDFCDYIAKLADVCGMAITDIDSLCAALATRTAFFDENGCRTADHGFDDAVVFDDTKTPEEAKAAANEAFKKVLAGEKATAEMTTVYKSAMIRFFGAEYVKYGWIMQIHFGAMRSPNTIMKNLLGPDTGYDTINGTNCIQPLARLLDALNNDGALPKTVLYSLNPTDNAALGTLIGSFQYTSEEAEGLTCLPPMQHGSAWWFNDHIRGMREQLQNLASLSALGKFIGMLTDSRSFLSYTRHEYFRRILCSVIGGYVERGEYPYDIETLAQMICDICYNNTKDFFEFKLI
jgi:glucuronate isomerase